jgi:hypothetical protein
MRRSYEFFEMLTLLELPDNCTVNSYGTLVVT